MTKTDQPFALNQRVKITGENGFYWVRGYGKDGSATLWGGDKNPNGHRQYRSIKIDRLKADDRALAGKSAPVEIEEDD